jgi:protein-tyrosine-phosphatase
MTSSTPPTPAAPPEPTLERVLAGVARRVEAPLEALLKVPWLRRALAKRARRAWQMTHEPLILCYGNINRSPFAALLAAARSGKRATSAGLFPVPDRAAPAASVERARHYGVALDDHRSRVAQREELTSAAAIFVFDLENVARLAAQAPRALHRTHLLGLLAHDRTVFIQDPHARPTEVLERAYEQISDALAANG